MRLGLKSNAGKVTEGEGMCVRMGLSRDTKGIGLVLIDHSAPGRRAGGHHYCCLHCLACLLLRSSWRQGQAPLLSGVGEGKSAAVSIGCLHMCACVQHPSLRSALKMKVEGKKKHNPVNK